MVDSSWQGRVCVGLIPLGHRGFARADPAAGRRGRLGTPARLAVLFKVKTQEMGLYYALKITTATVGSEPKFWLVLQRELQCFGTRGHRVFEASRWFGALLVLLQTAGGPLTIYNGSKGGRIYSTVGS